MESWLVEVFETESYGRGLKAIREIQEGEVVATEEAIIRDTPEELMVYIAQHIQEFDLRPVQAEGQTAAKAARAQFEHNSFLTSSPSGPRPRYALLPHCAKFNHGCRPNAVLHKCTSGDGRIVARIVAIQTIPLGSEVTICYRGLELMMQPQARRQKILQVQMDFSCGCVDCRRGDFDPNDPELILSGTSALVSKERVEELGRETDRVFAADGVVDDPTLFRMMTELLAKLRSELSPHHWRTRSIRFELIRFFVADLHMLQETKPASALSDIERSSMLTLADLLVEQMVAEQSILPPLHNARLASYSTLCELASYFGLQHPRSLQFRTPLASELDWDSLDRAKQFYAKLDLLEMS